MVGETVPGHVINLRQGPNDTSCIALANQPVSWPLVVRLQQLLDPC